MSIQTKQAIAIYNKKSTVGTKQTYIVSHASVQLLTSAQGC